MKVKINQQRVRQTIAAFDPMVGGDKHAYVCLSEWHNGEGIDVEINEKGCEALFRLTWDGWEALRKAMKIHQQWDGAEHTARNDQEERHV